MKLNYSVIILSAGFGKRMMPLTKDLPKPLIKINGTSLLDNSINILKKIGFNKIIINMHYQHSKIKEVISSRKDIKDITLIYENEILDTGGGVKNAVRYSNSKNILVVNSDIFLRENNIKDIKKLIDKYEINKKPHLLLVGKENAYGLDKKEGDFNLNKDKISRFKDGQKIFYYTGLQVFNSDILKNFSKKKFSFNVVWDYLINKEVLHGNIMHSNWYHVGNIQGLAIAKEENS